MHFDSQLKEDLKELLWPRAKRLSSVAHQDVTPSMWTLCYFNDWLTEKYLDIDDFAQCKIYEYHLGQILGRIDKLKH